MLRSLQITQEPLQITQEPLQIAQECLHITQTTLRNMLRFQHVTIKSMYRTQSTLRDMQDGLC